MHELAYHAVSAVRALGRAACILIEQIYRNTYDQMNDHEAGMYISGMLCFQKQQVAVDCFCEIESCM